MNNLLLHGDNLEGLKYLLQQKNLASCIDLVYIDPPFATGGNFTITDGRASTISNSRKGKIAYCDVLTGSAFIDFLRQRLVLIKDLMSDQGSIYLHIDYKIGHYVKILMDEIFGIENFRNDITRVKCNPKNFARLGYGNMKDMILFYSKTATPLWNEPHLAYSDSDLEKLYPKIDSTGRRYTTVPIHAPGETINGKSNRPFKGLLPPKGRHWRTDVESMELWDQQGLIEWSSTGNPRKIIFADERTGKRVQDIWEFKDPQIPVYPTEKNAQMLELIINTSSQADSIVLDCFCGSGTTLKAAQKMGRTWIVMDQSDMAIKIAQNKINEIKSDLFSPAADYELVELSSPLQCVEE